MMLWGNLSFSLLAKDIPNSMTSVLNHAPSTPKPCCYIKTSDLRNGSKFKTLSSPFEPIEEDLRMERFFHQFVEAHKKLNGYLLALTITPVAPKSDPGRLYDFFRASNAHSIETDLRYVLIWNGDLGLSKEEGKIWLDIFSAYWRAIGDILTAEELSTQARQHSTHWNKVYESWKEVVNALIQGYSKGILQAWTVPCLYVVGRYLRTFAIRADVSQSKVKGNISFTAGFQDDLVGDAGKHDKLEDAARVINRIFSLCISDRAPIEESRKWAIYYTTNLLFKTYFKLNSITLSKNILRSLQATNTDMPPLEAYPKSHVVTFKYYVGVIFFLEEDYAKAEEHLTQAWKLCNKASKRNLELILTYLIPCRLLTTHKLPTDALLSPYPRLKALFGPLGECIRSGDLVGFSNALAAGQDEFVKRRIYLTLERGRDIALRNLFRKVFLAGGFDQPKEGEDSAVPSIRRTRIPILEFAAALRIGLGSKPADHLDMDEVECLIANMIYKNLMKGYIARERSMVVLSKGGQAFPGTGV